MQNDEDQSQSSKSPSFQPSDFMKLRHPDLFPDTLPLSIPVLDPGYFEYELESLTKKKKELVFEDFCRRLAQLEICPNLKPITGPLGGGDGKTDAQTYPVAQVLAERCYWGTPKPSPADEKWAFAFSAKEKWEGKVSSDVEKIAGLDRGFSKVIFITNQFVKGSKRQDVESELSKTYGLDVDILDRSWIVEKVIGNSREQVAIDALSLQVSCREKPRLGPNDAARQQELYELLEKLVQPDTYLGNDYAMAQDYLQAALLARGLGKPRHEIDGFFTRARDLARIQGDRGQIIRTGYQHAWTSYWWFDDAMALEKYYTDMEGHLAGTPDAEDCELFCNLWILLFGAVKRRVLKGEAVKLDSRRDAIVREIYRLKQEEDRPNNALHAETQLYMLETLDVAFDEGKAERVFQALQNCIERSAGLLTYPTMRFIDNILDIGESVGHLPGYDKLFKVIRKILRERSGEVEEGIALYDRGTQLSRLERFQEALVHLGQSRVKLSKRETLDDMIFASLSCASTYKAMGLNWAARMEALNAVHVCLASQEPQIELFGPALLGTKLLSWIELELGRISPFLAWHRLSWVLVDQARPLGFNVESVVEQLHLQEGILACFFRNLDSNQVKDLKDLPECLDRLGLPLAATALLYQLGDSNSACPRLQKLFSLQSSEVDEYFQYMKNQPAAEQRPKILGSETRPESVYETTLLGVHYQIRCENSFGATAFAENLLGIIESALSLAKWENLAFITDRVDIAVGISTNGTNPPPIRLDERPNLEGYRFVWQPDILEWLNKSNRKSIADYFMNFLLKLLVDITIDPMEDIEAELSRWNSEDVFSMALGTSPSSVALTNLLWEETYDYRLWCKTSSSSKI